LSLSLFLLPGQFCPKLPSQPRPAAIDPSPTLQEWLGVGGQSLCTRASQTQQQLEQQKAQANIPAPHS